MQDKDFIKSEKVPMSKEEIRYITMGYLEIYDKKKFLDIGSGTGSITIESLMQNKNIKVTAIESDERAYSTTLMNIESFEQRYGNIKNRVKLIKGKAPINLKEKYDSIFIGGTKGSVKEIINWSSENLEENGTLVLNFISLENFYEAIDVIKQNDTLSQEDIAQIGVSKVQSIGRYTYFKPNNPVFIIKAKKITKEN